MPSHRSRQYLKQVHNRCVCFPRTNQTVEGSDTFPAAFLSFLQTKKFMSDESKPPAASGNDQAIKPDGPEWRVRQVNEERLELLCVFV